MVEVAGGRATDGRQRILEKVPSELHGRSPLFIGSKGMMQELENCYK
jgi:fructose-1,6-bisphosphatase I